MVWMVWTGAGLAVVGLLCILGSIFAVSKAKRAGLEDEALRARLTQILPLNIGGLLLAILGLMMLLMGVLLG